MSGYTPPAHHKVYQKLLEQITENLQLEEILTKLFSSELITLKCMEKMKRMLANDGAIKTAEFFLLEVMIKKPDKGSFDKFVAILRKANHEHMADTLEKELQKVLEEQKKEVVSKQEPRMGARYGGWQGQREVDRAVQSHQGSGQYVDCYGQPSEFTPAGGQLPQYEYEYRLGTSLSSHSGGSGYHQQQERMGSARCRTLQPHWSLDDDPDMMGQKEQSNTQQKMGARYGGWQGQREVDRAVQSHQGSGQYVDCYGQPSEFTPAGGQLPQYEYEYRLGTSLSSHSGGSGYHQQQERMGSARCRTLQPHWSLDDDPDMMGQKEQSNTQQNHVAESLSTLSLDEKYRMVAAIDLGRTYSGYAFSFRGDKNHIQMNRSWGANVGLQSYKTPTSVMVDSANKFVAFGYEAEDRYSQTEEEDSDSDSEYFTSNYHLYRNFTAFLCGNEKITKNHTIPSVDGKMTSALEIFVMVLKYFKCHLDDALRLADLPVERSAIRWVILSTEGAKEFIKEAAYRAGLIQNKYSNQLIIASGSEAASVYCRSLDVNQFIQHLGEQSLPSFRAGDKFMVIDAGGDTVDFTVHEVLRLGKMKTIQTTSEGAGGGSLVDQNFVQLLNNILGRNFIHFFQKNCPQQWLLVIVNFQYRIRSARPDGAYKISITITYAMGGKYQEICGKKIDKAIKQSGMLGVSYSNGMLFLEHEVVVSLFQPVIHSILSHLDSLLSESAMRGCSCLMLVGEFAQSAFLKKAITDRFGSRVRVLVPEDAQLAVVKGAVLCGHTPDHFLDSN